MYTISQNAFSDIFPKQLGIFSLNFTCLLNIHTYARMRIFVQLPPTVTKFAILSATTQRAFRLMVDIHIMVVAINIA